MRALLFMAYIKGEAVTQGSLFPVSLDELIPADLPVRVIAAYVDSLALDALGFSKAVTKATGRPPYDPADMLKLYVYGYLHRVRSSRRLEAECQRNVEVMWLLSRLTPDFKTIAEFRRLNSKAFTAVCRSFVQFCRHAGLIAGELIAIDGSKFQAASSRKQYTSAARLVQQQAALDKQIASYLTQLDHSDKAEADTVVDRSAVHAALQQLQAKQETVTAANYCPWRKPRKWFCSRMLSPSRRMPVIPTASNSKPATISRLKPLSPPIAPSTIKTTPRTFRKKRSPITPTAIAGAVPISVR